MKAFTISPDRIIVALWGLATITTFFAILFDNSNIGVSISASMIAFALCVTIYLSVLKGEEEPITTRFAIFTAIAFPIITFVFFIAIADAIIEIISLFNYSGPHFAQASIVTFTGTVTVFLIIMIKKSKKTRIHANSFNNPDLPRVSFKNVSSIMQTSEKH